MLRFADHHGHFATVIAAVRDAADARRATVRAIEREPIDADSPVIAMGKAAAAMAAGVAEAVPGHRGRGMVISPESCGGVVLPSNWVRHAGDHPLPSERSIAAGGALAAFARELTAMPDGAEVVALISGGASALACVPVEGVTLEDLRFATQAVMRAGGNISQLNAVRRSIDAIKGGGLARMLSPRRVRALAVSDVIGDSPWDIASGPLSENPTTAADAVGVLRALGVEGECENLVRVLRRQAEEEGSGAAGGASANVRYEIILRNLDARSAAMRALMGMGALTFGGPIHTGSAESLGRALANQAVMLHSGRRPGAAVFGGETTVAVTGEGHGGRNQHAALTAAAAMAADRPSAVLTLATDGVDGVAPRGVTAPAGAIVTNQTAGIARAMGLEPLAFLRECDSYGFFANLDERQATRGLPAAQVVTGPTGTNVNDLAVVIAY